MGVTETYAEEYLMPFRQRGSGPALERKATGKVKAMRCDRRALTRRPSENGAFNYSTFFFFFALEVCISPVVFPLC